MIACNAASFQLCMGLATGYLKTMYGKFCEFYFIWTAFLTLHCRNTSALILRVNALDSSLSSLEPSEEGISGTKHERQLNCIFALGKAPHLVRKRKKLRWIKNYCSRLFLFTPLSPVIALGTP